MNILVDLDHKLMWYELGKLKFQSEICIRQHTVCTQNTFVIGYIGVEKNHDCRDTKRGVNIITFVWSANLFKLFSEMLS